MALKEGWSEPATGIKPDGNGNTITSLPVPDSPATPKPKPIF